MNKILKIASLTMGGLLGAAGIILAAPLPNDPTTLVTQKIKGGNLTLQAPADVDLGQVDVSSQVTNVTGDATNFLVDDARGNKVAPGWTATLTMSRLTDSIDPTTFIPFVDTVASQNVYTLTPKNLQVYHGANLADVTLGSVTELADTDNNGTSDAVNVMSAASTMGRGRFGSDIGIGLKIPANSVASDNYQSTMTFTVS